MVWGLPADVGRCLGAFGSGWMVVTRWCGGCPPTSAS